MPSINSGARARQRGPEMCRITPVADLQGGMGGLSPGPGGPLSLPVKKYFMRRRRSARAGQSADVSEHAKNILTFLGPIVGPGPSGPIINAIYFAC